MSVYQTSRALVSVGQDDLWTDRRSRDPAPMQPNGAAPPDRARRRPCSVGIAGQGAGQRLQARHLPNLSFAGPTGMRADVMSNSVSAVTENEVKPLCGVVDPCAALVMTPAKAVMRRAVVFR